MSIIYFPRRKRKSFKNKNTKEKVIIRSSNAKPFVNHQYIEEVMSEHGYRRDNDELLLTLKKLGVKI